MPLRDLEPWHEWLRRESPSAAARSVARSFMAEVGDEPWRAPSVPVDRLSDQPVYEMRYAELPVAGEMPVEVWYRHYYATGDVDVIAVTNQ